MYGPTPSHVPLKTRNYFKHIGFLHKDAVIDTDNKEKAGQENLEKEGVIWVTDTCTASEVNFESLKLTRLLPCSVQSVLSSRRHSRCTVGKTSDFSDLKIKATNSYF